MLAITTRTRVPEGRRHAAADHQSRTETFRPRDAAHQGDAFIRRQLFLWDLEGNVAKALRIARPFLRAAAFYAASEVTVTVWSGTGRVGLRISADHDIPAHGSPTLHDLAGPAASAIAEAASWDMATEPDHMSVWFELAVANWLHPLPSAGR